MDDKESIIALILTKFSQKEIDLLVDILVVAHRPSVHRSMKTIRIGHRVRFMEDGGQRFGKVLKVTRKHAYVVPSFEEGFMIKLPLYQVSIA